MSNKILKYVAYGVGASVLLAGAFFLFAALSGTPMSDLAVVGDAFPDEEEGPAAATQDEVHPQDELDGDRRSSDQIVGEAVRGLEVFTLPAGFTAQELSELEAEIERALTMVQERESALEKREQELDERKEMYDAMFANLERLRGSLENREAESEARAAELDTQTSEAKAQRRREMARLADALFGEGIEAKQAVLMLKAHTPDEAAFILAALEPDRAGELLAALYENSAEDWRTFSDAYAAVRDDPAPPGR